MTGYGRGLAERGGHRVVVEMRSVNHRYLDLKLRGAPLGPEAENAVTKRVKNRVARGSIALSVRVRRAATSVAMRVDLPAARRTIAELRRLETLGLEGGISYGLLCAQPGVLVSVDSGDETDEDLLACVLEATDASVEALLEMRKVEGSKLAEDLGQRLARLQELAAEIRTHAELAPKQAGARLQERIEKLLAQSNVEVDPTRIAQEVALLADRLDITEELVRIKSHVSQASALLQSSEPVGRKLEFLVQELGREVNTIVSKSQSSDIGSLGVEAKAELERIREQVQNVE